MRSAWFRGRAPAEVETQGTPDAPPAHDDEERAPDAAPPAIGQPGIRTAFTHPTF
jgi:hypothetical protein